MSIVIRVFDETGHIGYLGFNDAGPFITNLAKAQEYGDGDFDAAVYDAQRFARENFGVFNTCPVIEAVYQRFQAVVDALNGWDITSHAAADPSGGYGILAKKANYAARFYAHNDAEVFEVYDHSDDRLPEQSIGYDTAAGDIPFTAEELTSIIACTA